MNTDFFPGFEVEDEVTIISNDGHSSGFKPEVVKGYGSSGPRLLRTNAEKPTISRFDTFAFRVRQFATGLAPQRRAEIARRPRFRNQPYLRRVDEPDEDTLP